MLIGRLMVHTLIDVLLRKLQPRVTEFLSERVSERERESKRVRERREREWML